METAGGGAAAVRDPQLAATAVSKRFGGVSAVEDISIAVKRSEIVSIIGPNGAGKTSLLNMISGFYRPTSGSILFEGRDYHRGQAFLHRQAWHSAHVPEHRAVQRAHRPR